MVLRVAVLLFTAITATLPAQADWTRLYPSAAPGPRSDFAFAFDGAHAVTLLFGGSTSTTGYTNHLWQWNGANWSQLFPPAGPSARNDSAMAFDELRGRVVLFGGNDGNNNLQDTWEWDGASWSLRTPASRPLPRQQHAMAYDPVRRVVLLFGGMAPANVADLWEWNGVNWLQRIVLTGVPSPRRQTALAFDPNTNTMLLFGGFAGQPMDDTWSWTGQAWQQLQPTNPPYSRSQHSMVTDVARRRVVLLGGDPVVDPFVWEWDGTNWRCVFVSSPTPRRGEGMAYDSARGEVVVYGGVSNYQWTDTWVYRTAQPASFTQYGQGCPGSAGTPALTAAPYSLPWLGDVFRTRVDAIPAAGAGAVFVTGFASTPAQSLAPVGLPGCASFVTLDSSQFVLASGGIAEWSIQIPLSMALAGWALYQQALVLDPSTTGGAVVSNAGTATVGIR
jgi:hypothetical protein